MTSAGQPEASREALSPPATPANDGPVALSGAARPVHLYDAVSTQRDHVLGSFDSQRTAILKAVADQREAALAPVKFVQARQSAPSSGSNAALRGQLSPQLMVATEIVAHLKAIVADEVRLQLLALLEAATVRQGATADGAPSDR